MSFIKRISSGVTVFILFCIIALLTVFSDNAKSGAIVGINLCENIIIPSLLPILIISNIITKTIAPLFISRLVSKIIKLPAVCFPCILLGLVSGFPAGAILTSQLYKSGELNEKQAKRIMSFNFCGGCAFIISALGGAVYKNIKAGLILYLSCVFSSLIAALISALFDKKEENNSHHILSPQKFSDALCSSSETSVKSIAIMSAYIILFSALINIISIPDMLIPLFEITNGICKANALFPLPLCAFFLSFGGFCIHLQIFPFLREMKIKYIDFLISRTLCASLSYLICKVMLYFSNDSKLVSFSPSPALPFEISGLGGGLSLVMIIGCAVLVFEVENRKLSA